MKIKYKQNVTQAVKDLMNKSNLNGYYLEKSGYVKTTFKPYKKYSGGVTEAKLTPRGETLLKKIIKSKRRKK